MSKHQLYEERVDVKALKKKLADTKADSDLRKKLSGGKGASWSDLHAAGAPHTKEKADKEKEAKKAPDPLRAMDTKHVLGHRPLAAIVGKAKHVEPKQAAAHIQKDRQQSRAASDVKDHRKKVQKFVQKTKAAKSGSAIKPHAGRGGSAKKPGLAARAAASVRKAGEKAKGKVKSYASHVKRLFTDMEQELGRPLTEQEIREIYSELLVLESSRLDG